MIYIHTRTDIRQGFQSLVSRVSLYSHAAPPLFLLFNSPLSHFYRRGTEDEENTQRGTRPAAGSSHTFIKHSFSPNHHQPSLPPSLLPILSFPLYFISRCSLSQRPSSLYSPFPSSHTLSLSLPCFLSFFFVVGHCFRNAPSFLLLLLLLVINFSSSPIPSKWCFTCCPFAYPTQASWSYECFPV